MTHSRSRAPSCDIFNLGSSYFHVPLTTVRHLLNVYTITLIVLYSLFLFLRFVLLGLEHVRSRSEVVWWYNVAHGGGRFGRDDALSARFLGGFGRRRRRRIVLTSHHHVDELDECPAIPHPPSHTTTASH